MSAYGTVSLCPILSFLDAHAGGIQSVCAAFGLLGLIWYCILTRGIHKAALRQASAAIRPFIVTDELKETDVPNFQLNTLPISKKKIIIIRNLGSGPAMDIFWSLTPKAGTTEEFKWISLGDLAVNDWSYIFDDAPTPAYLFERPDQGMVFRFLDSAGDEHETIEVMRKGRFYQHCRRRNSKDGL
jgi:hypothetical protein